MRHILLAESYTPIRQALALILQRAGWKVDLVTTSQDILEALRQCQYDVLLVDVDASPRDGWNALEALRLLRRRPSVIALLEGDLCERAHSLGADIVLEKPITRKRLLASLLQATHITASHTTAGQVFS